MRMGASRDDFMSAILRKEGDKGMSREEIESSINTLVVAGSETNATLMSALIYLLALHPTIQTTLLAELTATFLSPAHLSMSKLASLPYLNAVLEEGLRLYPPSAFNHSRIVPAGGAVICGQLVQGGTAVGVAMWAASRSKSNWTDAEKFIPERWIGEGLAGDDRKSMQLFLLGPRVCLGKR